MARSLIVEILGNSSGFAKELDRAAGKTRQMGKVAGVAGLAIAGGLAVGLEKSVKAAADAQVSTAKMDQAFTASGQSAKAFAGQIDGAEQSGRNLGFTNTDIRDSLGTLEIATHSGAKAIQDLSTAEDIARFKHMKLADASKVLTQTMAGSTRAAHMLGIQTQSVTAAEDKVKAAFTKHSGAAYTAALATAKFSDKQATAKLVLQEVSDKLGGQAQAFANTAQGGMARFHAQVEAIQENLGSALLPALGSMSQKLATVTGWLAKHTTVAKIAVGVLGGLAAVLLTVSAMTKIQTAAQELQTFATKVGTLAAKAFAAGQWLVNAALAANPIGIVVIALAALGVAFAIAWEKSRRFREIVTGAWNDVKHVAEGVAGFFTSTVPHAFEAMGSRIIGAVNTVRSALAHAWGDIKSTMSNAFSDIGHLAGRLFAAPIDAIIGAIDSIELPSGVEIKTKHILGIPVPDGFSVQWSHPFNIPMLAEGGIAMGPTLALIGEKGPEAVMPLDGRAGGSRGGDIIVNVGPVHGSVDSTFARKLAEEIAAHVRGGRVPQFQQAMKAL